MSGDLGLAGSIVRIVPDVPWFAALPPEMWPPGLVSSPIDHAVSIKMMRPPCIVDFPSQMGHCLPDLVLVLEVLFLSVVWVELP